MKNRTLNRLSSFRTFFILTILLVLSACERRPLEVLLDERVRVRLIINWKVNFVTLYGEQPNGMTVMVWPSGEDAVPMVTTTNSDHVELYLTPDTYRLIVYNEVVSDYAPYMRFDSARSYDNIAMRAATYTPSATSRFYASRAADAPLMYAPEDPRIAVAVDTFEITPDMVLQDTTIFVPYEDYRRYGYDLYEERVHLYEIEEEPWPMTVDLFVELRMRNRRCVRSMDAVVSGMADGFYLSRINRTTGTGTLHLPVDKWRVKAMDDIAAEVDTLNLGLFVGQVASFGLPYGKEALADREPEDNMLRFDILLFNDSIVSYSFPVGKIMQYLTPEGEEARIRYRQDLRHLQVVIDLPDTIDIPPIEPASNNAGFDAEVADWEEGDTFDLGTF